MDNEDVVIGPRQCAFAGPPLEESTWLTQPAALSPSCADGGDEELAGSPAVRSRQASKQASPGGSPGAASPTKPGSPTSSDSDGCRCESTERRFFVKGDWLDGDKRIQLRLRICEPTGERRSSLACLRRCIATPPAPQPLPACLPDPWLFPPLPPTLQAPPAPWSLSLMWRWTRLPTWPARWFPTWS